MALSLSLSEYIFDSIWVRDMTSDYATVSMCRSLLPWMYLCTFAVVYLCIWCMSWKHVSIYCTYFQCISEHRIPSASLVLQNLKLNLKKSFFFCLNPIPATFPSTGPAVADGLAVAIASSRPQRGKFQCRPKRRDWKHGRPTAKCYETCECGRPDGWDDNIRSMFYGALECTEMYTKLWSEGW